MNVDSKMLSHMRIMRELMNREYNLTIDEILLGELNRLINIGLYSLIMCLSGDNTSPLVVYKCVRNRIPAVSIYGGMYTFDRALIKYSRLPITIANDFEKLPLLVLLSPKERIGDLYPQLMSQVTNMKNVQYCTGENALNTIAAKYTSRATE